MKHETPKSWTSEREFFDAQALTAADFDLPKIAERYAAARGHALHRTEIAYESLGDIRDKRLLDIGCGLGEHSLLFASWGAKVTGVDISGASIAVARQRAARFGLSERVSFLETSFDLMNAADSDFDIVWCSGFLHHVLHTLEEVCDRLQLLLAPQGFVLLSEPVRLSRATKLLSSLLPTRIPGTANERPLERQDLKIISCRFEIEVLRLFGPVSRVQRLIIPGSYEEASSSRRWCADVLYRMDRQLMRLPGLRAAAMIMLAKLRPRLRPGRTPFTVSNG